MRPIIWQVVGLFVVVFIVHILFQNAEIKTLNAENNKIRLLKKL